MRVVDHAGPASSDGGGSSSGGSSSGGSSSGASSSGASSSGGGGDDSGPVTPWDGGAFVHPGVLNARAQLDFVKAQIAAGKEPWTSALAAAKADPLAAPTYATATPQATIVCGSKSSGPDAALCKAEQSDSGAAYANAILWYVTGDPAYAQKSIAIMDTWSAVFTSHGTPLDPAASNQFV